MSGRTLQLSLPDDLAAEIAGAVARGEYGSENDMVVGAVAEWLARRRAGAAPGEYQQRSYQTNRVDRPAAHLS